MLTAGSKARSATLLRASAPEEEIAVALAEMSMTPNGNGNQKGQGGGGSSVEGMVRQLQATLATELALSIAALVKEGEKTAAASAVAAEVREIWVVCVLIQISNFGVFRDSKNYGG